jgi:hypothetical protein
MVVANNEINGNKKYTSNAGKFDGHADTAVRCRVHLPMERISGIMQSHEIPPLGKCPTLYRPGGHHGC